MKNIKFPKIKVMSLITVLSLILSVYFYLDAKKSHGLSYVYSTESSMIFNKKNALGLKLYENDTILIDNNVYLLKGTVWNSGDFPITKDDIRKNLVIEFKGIERILDFEITKQVDDEISKFKLHKLNLNKLGIDWEYFDPNNGFSFQVLYIGDNLKDISITGKVLNIESFNKIEFKALDENSKKDILSTSISLGIGLASLLSIFVLSRVPKNILKSKKIAHFFDSMTAFWITILILSIILIGIIYIIIIYFIQPAYPSGLL